MPKPSSPPGKKKPSRTSFLFAGRSLMAPVGSVLTTRLIVAGSFSIVENRTSMNPTS